MIKLILTIYISFLSINLSFALDYYQMAFLDRKYLSSEDVHPNSENNRFIYVDIGDISPKKLNEFIGKEFIVVKESGEILTLKSEKVVFFNGFQVVNQEYHPKKFPFLLLEKPKGSKLHASGLIAFPKGKVEVSYEPIKFPLLRFGEFENVEKQLNGIKINFPAKYDKITEAGSAFSEDKKWVKISRMNSKDPFEPRFSAILYNGQVVKQFSGIDRKMSLYGIITVNGKKYVLIMEEVKFHNSYFFMLYEFDNGKVGKRISPLNLPNYIDRDILQGVEEERERQLSEAAEEE